MIGFNGGNGKMFTNVEATLWQKAFLLAPLSLSLLPTDVMNARCESPLIEKRTEEYVRSEAATVITVPWVGALK
jgi:hypothetical protein